MSINGRADRAGVGNASPDGRSCRGSLPGVSRPSPGATVMAALALCMLAGGAAASIQTSLGTSVHLAGISYGSSSVYLFLTGPNLPADGVALDNVASVGGMTRVDVDSDGSWSYDWDTHALPLDEGTYTVWAVDSPVGRTGLSGHDYATIAVTFTSPGLSVSVPVIPGTLEIHAVPENASVVLNGRYQGMAPVTAGDLSPGSYTVTVSHFGYHPVTRPVTVESGSTTVMNVTLALSTGSVRIATDPNGSRIFLDGNSVGNAPLTLQDIPTGNHTVTAEREGFDPAMQAIAVPADQTVNVSLTLLPRNPATPNVTMAGTTVVPLAVTLATCLALPVALRRRRA